MDSFSRKVSVELRTVIDDAGTKEYNTVSQIGDFFKKNKFDVLTYDEDLEQGASVRNLITIHPDKVSIKRTGIVHMHQQFQVNQLTENLYKHPHGNIHMETFTNAINYQELTLEHHGFLAINYTVRLNGQQERKHQLQLAIKEEGS